MSLAGEGSLYSEVPCLGTGGWAGGPCTVRSHVWRQAGPGGGGCCTVWSNGHIVTCVCGQIVTTENITFPHLRQRAVILIKTRMHSSRMRTARSLPYRGVSVRGVSLTKAPPDRDPPGQRPPCEQNYTQV